MAKIIVYPYTIYNPKNDSHELARGMCTEETILKIKNATIIKSKPKEIDDSELTQSDRYHDPSQEKTKEKL